MMKPRHVSIIDLMKRRKEEHGLILNWLLRVGLFLVVAGIVLFDIGSIVVNSISLSGSAEDVAVTVSISISERGGGTIVPDSIIYDMAVDVVESETEGVAGARVLRRGTEIDEEGIVHVRLRRRSETLVAHLIGPLDKYTVSTGNGQAGTN